MCLQSEGFLRIEFREHVATYKRDDAMGIEALDFCKPRTRICALHYLLDTKRGVLTVHGDMEAAVYSWYGSCDLNWIAGCGLDYFLSKLEASRCDRGRRWCGRCAQAWLDDWRAERLQISLPAQLVRAS